MNEVNLMRGAQEFGSDAGWSIEAIDGKFVSFTPNTHFKIKYYEYSNSANIDHFGGRAVAAEGSRRKYEVLVPFLGDSFAFGIGVEDQQTFISLLGEQSDFEYLNLGVPGSALPNHLDVIEFRHRELHAPPIYVFTFFTGNDYQDMIHYFSREPAEVSAKHSATADFMERHLYRNRFFGRSYLLQLIKVTFFLSPPPQEVSMAKRYKAWVRTPTGRRPLGSSLYLLMSGNPLYVADAERYANRAVERLENLSGRFHFLALFIIIPDKHQVDPELFEKQARTLGLDVKALDNHRPNEIIEKVLQSHGIRYFDLFDCVKGQRGLYYNIDDHFTPAGHRVVAKCLSGSMMPFIESYLHQHGK